MSSDLTDRLVKAKSLAVTAYRWRKFLVRTAAYCSVSVSARPFTGESFPQRLMRIYFEDVLRTLDIRVIADGVEKLHGALPAMITVNHNSMLDIPCVGVLLDFDYKWVAKKEVFDVPFVGWHLKACGHIPVDRSRRDNAKKLERSLESAVARGGSILMFPEGTRSKDGRLQAFRKGAFVMAVRHGIPTLPIVLDGTDRLLEKGSLEFPGDQPSKIVRIKVMDPVPPPDEREGDFDARVVLMRDRARAAMVAALDDIRGEAGAAERPTSADTPELGRTKAK